MKAKPLGNNVLIEVLSNADSVSRSGNLENEVLNYGILRKYSFIDFHLTASAALHFDAESMKMIGHYLKSLENHVVRWEQYAEGGQTFVEDGKTYALIPWWRLIGCEE